MSRNEVGQDRICAQLQVKPNKKQEEEIKQAILDGDTGKEAELRAAFFKSKMWDIGTTLNVVFENLNPVINQDITLTPSSYMDTSNGPMDPLQIEFLEKGNNINIPEAIERIVLERLAPLVNLTINFRDNSDSLQEWDGITNNDNEIVISFIKNNGSYSYVGTDINYLDEVGPTMNFGWFDVSTVMHEFCHVFGMIHEHQNPFGVEIDWNLPELYKWASDTQDWDKEMTNTQIVDKYNQSDINGSEFDPCSVMLYFYPGDLTNNGVGTNQNLRLSPVDMTWLANQYPDAPLNNKNSVEEFYLSIYPDEDSNSFDDKMLICKDMAVKFGDSQPIQDQDSNFFPKIFNKDNRTIMIIIILVILIILIIVLLLFK